MTPRLALAVNRGHDPAPTVVPDLESIKEAARLIHGSPSFVRKLLRAGELQGVRIGRRVLVERASIAGLIQRGRVESMKGGVR